MEAARTLEHAGYAGACPVTGGIMTDYYKHLSRVQNRYQLVDIMTITGFMDSEQKTQHLLRYAELTKDREAADYAKRFARTR